MGKTNLIDLRRFKKLEKQYIVINFFLDNLDCTISDICEYFGNTISSSSVQRYLNDYDFFKLYLDDEKYEIVQKALMNNKLTGNSRGGINSFMNNVPTRNEAGEFTGSEKDRDDHRMLAKLYHVKIFGSLLRDNPRMSLSDIAALSNEQCLADYEITKSYVYDCLTSPYLEDMFSKEDVLIIQNNLHNNKKVL